MLCNCCQDAQGDKLGFLEVTYGIFPVFMIYCIYINSRINCKGVINEEI